MVIRAVQAEGGTDPALRADVVVRVPRAALIEKVHVIEGRIVIHGFRGVSRLGPSRFAVLDGGRLLPS